MEKREDISGELGVWDLDGNPEMPWRGRPVLSPWVDGLNTNITKGTKSLIKEYSMRTSFRARLFFMHDTVPHFEFTRMIITLWAIWSARRKTIHENIF